MGLTFQKKAINLQHETIELIFNRRIKCDEKNPSEINSKAATCNLLFSESTSDVTIYI